MTNLEKIELQCRRLIAEKDSGKRSEILADSVGYLGLAQAYVELSNLLFQEKLRNSQDLQGN